MSMFKQARKGCFSTCQVCVFRHSDFIFSSDFTSSPTILSSSLAEINIFASMDSVSSSTLNIDIEISCLFKHSSRYLWNRIIKDRTPPPPPPPCPPYCLTSPPQQAKPLVLAGPGLLLLSWKYFLSSEDQPCLEWSTWRPLWALRPPWRPRCPCRSRTGCGGSLCLIHKVGN